jgi:hypothetical protein
MPEMIDGLPPLPVPNVCPVTLDELLADHLADLCGVVVTRDLAEHLMIWAGERFAGLEGRLDRVIVLLERISGA